MTFMVLYDFGIIFHPFRYLRPWPVYSTWLMPFAQLVFFENVQSNIFGLTPSFWTLPCPYQKLVSISLPLEAEHKRTAGKVTLWDFWGQVIKGHTAPTSLCLIPHAGLGKPNHMSWRSPGPRKRPQVSVLATFPAGVSIDSNKCDFASKWTVRRF